MVSPLTASVSHELEPQILHFPVTASVPLALDGLLLGVIDLFREPSFEFWFTDIF